SSSGHSTLDHSSSRHSTSDHSSSGHSTSGHSSSGHTPPVTTIADSSTPSRFIYPPPTRTSPYREAFRRWRSAPLSTMYPLMTSESLARDSSSESSARPSRKRCRSPAATVTLSIHALGALVPSHADLLPPRKRFRDSISPEDSIKEDIDIDVLADIKADVAAVEVVAGMDVEAGVDTGIGMEVDVGVDIEDKVEDEAESSHRGTMEVGVDVVAGIDVPDDTSQRVEEIKSRQRELEARSLIASGERADLLDHVASLERSNASRHLDDEGAAKTARFLKVKPEWKILETTGNWWGGNGNGNGEGNGDGNGGGNGNGNGGGNNGDMENPNK
ncbi:hypothetical protein Tco_1165178, partial [Tanacetum coccineum]